VSDLIVGTHDNAPTQPNPYLKWLVDRTFSKSNLNVMKFYTFDPFFGLEQSFISEVPIRITGKVWFEAFDTAIASEEKICTRSPKFSSQRPSPPATPCKRTSEWL